MNINILLVDDDVDFSAIIAERFRRNGAGVVIANSAKDAISAIKEAKLDIIILDLYLPDMSGVDFVKLVRKENLKIPVILLTGHEEDELVLEAMRAGVSSYVQKPFDDAALWKKIEELAKITEGG